MAREYRGAPNPDPLRTQHHLDASRIAVDIYPRGLDPTQWSLSMGGCLLHVDSGVGRSIPGDPNPQHVENGVRIASVLYDPAWPSFRFVPGARYAIEAKDAAGTVIARLTFQAPSDFPSLSSASRTALAWTPFTVGPSDNVSIVGFHLSPDGYETKLPSVQISPPAGSASWDASDPTVDHAYLSWGRNLVVNGLARPQTLFHNWIHAF